MSKRIGIVDITTVGSTICQLAIVQKSAELDTNGNHPEFIVNSQSFGRYLNAQKENWDEIANIVLESIDSLEKAGADFVIIPANTIHYAFEKIQLHSPLPLLDLVSLVVDECAAQKYKRVAVLGTKLTMQGGLYDEKLKAKEILPVIPNEELCAEIDDFIFNELVPQKEKPESIARLASKLKELDCDAYLLGCTELPGVFNQNNLGTCIDTTRLLGYQAAAYAYLS